YETGTKIMGFDKAWRAGFKGKGQIVAIADTGLDTGNKATLARDFSNLKASYALGMSSTSWADYMGHGTHVAGSVAGNGSQSNKIVTGGALEAQIVAESLWSQKANNLTTPNNLGVIFQQAYNSGARIHTNSWGDPEAQGIYNTETMQVDQFVWDHPEMLILFASGNDGVDANRDGRIDSGAVSAPSTAKNIISVGASENLVLRGGVQRKLGEIGLTPNEKPWAAEPIASDTLSNNPKGIAAFSSRGPTQDGRIKPDLVAPGSNILSNCSKMEGAEELWGRFDENYCWSGGTSMSTPLVAGAAALVRERLMKIQGADTPSAALVKAVLLQTAVDLYPGQFGEVGKVNGQELLKPGPNFDQGYGRVDVGSAISEKLSLVDNKEGLGTGESKFYKPSGAIRKVTLVYNDAPASPIARKVLVNNLDLEVQVGGRTYTSKSLVDNNEQVTLPEGINTQNATIYVRGVSVPMGKSGKQPYALVF
ncbi:MAG: S8 family serine peptidase, partial [Bdellovibrionales bacterium]|nr:S8 family serine peptidase [Bdellovibrionales bacterium]